MNQKSHVVKWLGPLLCCLLWAAPAFSSWNVYQWTDSRGVMHFANHLDSVPEGFRDSPELIIRKGYLTPGPAPVLATRSQAIAEPKVYDSSPSATTEPAGIRPAVVYSPQSTTIIVVHSGGHNRHKGGKRGFRVHPHPLSTTSNRRMGMSRYVHPSALSGTPRLHVHPEAR